eukprot:6490637-Amphidinium_carterae.1
MLPISDVDEMLSDTTEDIDWDSHADSIQRIVASSWLGKSLFSFALPQILQKKVFEALSVAVATLAKESNVTEAKYLSARLDAKTLIRQIDDLATLPERREIVIVYRGWSLNCWVKSVEEECELRFACHLRAWASR